MEVSVVFLSYRKHLNAHHRDGGGAFVSLRPGGILQEKKDEHDRGKEGSNRSPPPRWGV